METSRRSDPPLLVPVRPGRASVALRLFRTSAGERTAVAFTSRDRLVRALGDGHAWMWLTERALRGMLENLDVTGIVIDPAGTLDGQDPRLRAA
ncbi:SAV_915 family protein [Streptosporangium sp. NPDC051023]|uniref:SAV_915 family protein n=1 Tax=Streptosporangium sp. NPDC051023 TaxID=3155410 RepID=UPI00344D5CA4